MVNIGNFIYYNALKCSGLVFLLELIPCILINNCIVEGIVKKYSNESVVAILKPQIVFYIITPLIVGGFAGAFIVPFFLFDSVTHIGLINRYTLCFYIILYLIASYVSLSGLLNCVVVTDKRIVSKNAIKSISFKDWNILIEDIIKIEFRDNGKMNFIVKTSKKYSLGAYRNSKKCYQDIEKIRNSHHNQK